MFAYLKTTLFLLLTISNSICLSQSQNQVSEISNLSLSNCLWLKVQNKNYIYIINSKSDSLYTVNIADIYNPILIGNFDRKLNPNNFDPHKSKNHNINFGPGYRIESRMDGGLIVTKFGEFVSKFGHKYFPGDIWLNKNILYVVTKDGSLKFVDVSNPSEFKEIGSYNEGNYFDRKYVHDIIFSGDQAFFQIGRDLKLMNISKIPSIEEVWSDPNPIGGKLINLYRSLIIWNTKTIKKIDIFNKKEPKELGKFISLNVRIRDVKALGDYIFLITSNGLKIIKIGN